MERDPRPDLARRWRTAARLVTELTEAHDEAAALARRLAPGRPVFGRRPLATLAPPAAALAAALSDALDEAVEAMADAELDLARALNRLGPLEDRRGRLVGAVDQEGQAAVALVPPGQSAVA